MEGGETRVKSEGEKVRGCGRVVVKEGVSERTREESFSEGEAMDGTGLAGTEWER